MTTTTSTTAQDATAGRGTGHASLDGYLAAMQSAGIPLLGFTVWYTVCDGQMTHVKLEQLFRKLGLELPRMPSPPRDVDAYEKVTGELEVTYPLDGREARKPGERAPRRKVGELRAEATLFVQHVARDSSRTAGWIERHVVRRVRDETKVELGYKVKLATAVFQKDKNPKSDPGAGGMSVKLEHANIADLPEKEQNEVAEFIAALKTGFEHRRRYLSADKLRAMVRDYVDSLGALQLKPGVYFVPGEHAQTLAALRELVNEFGAGSGLQMVPLPELDETREMIIEVYNQEAKAELDKLSKELTAALEGTGSVSGAVVKNLTKRFHKAQDAAEEHAARFKTNISATKSSLDSVSMQVAQLAFRQK